MQTHFFAHCAINTHAACVFLCCPIVCFDLLLPIEIPTSVFFLRRVQRHLSSTFFVFWEESTSTIWQLSNKRQNYSTGAYKPTATLDDSQYTLDVQWPETIPQNDFCRTTKATKKGEQEKKWEKREPQKKADTKKKERKNEHKDTTYKTKKQHNTKGRSFCYAKKNQKGVSKRRFPLTSTHAVSYFAKSLHRFVDATSFAVLKIAMLLLIFPTRHTCQSLLNLFATQFCPWHNISTRAYNWLPFYF